MNFSVLMSVYKNDKPKFVKASLDSVINQTITPSEIVLVVDGPISQELKNLINQYEKVYNNLKVIRQKENKGLGKTLNYGLENCSYSLVARMDADDICVKDRFEKQLKCFKEDKELSIVGGYIKEFIDNDKNIVGIREVPLENNDIKKYIKFRNPFNHMTVMFRKEDVIKAGNYQEHYYNEDYYLWIRMFLSKVKFKNIKDTLVHVRVGKQMYKRRGGYKYYKSEVDLQQYMLKNKMIKVSQFLYNILLKFLIQVVMPNDLRAYFYKKFLRKKAK